MQKINKLMTMGLVGITALSLQACIGTSMSGRSGSSMVSNVQGIDKKVTAYVIKQNSTGQETRTPVTSASQLGSGSLVEYQGHFTNNSGERVRSMTADLFIPAEVQLAGGIEPRYGYGSTDGRNFLALPLKTQVGSQLQAVPLSKYEALRWELKEINIGETKTVMYRAVVK